MDPASEDSPRSSPEDLNSSSCRARLAHSFRISWTSPARVREADRDREGGMKVGLVLMAPPVPQNLGDRNQVIVVEMLDLAVPEETDIEVKALDQGVGPLPVKVPDLLRIGKGHKTGIPPFRFEVGNNGHVGSILLKPMEAGIDRKGAIPVSPVLLEGARTDDGIPGELDIGPVLKDRGKGVDVSRPPRQGRRLNIDLPNAPGEGKRGIEVGTRQSLLQKIRQLEVLGLQK